MNKTSAPVTDLTGFSNLSGLKLRFPEFRDAGEWGEKSLESVCQSFSGGTPLTSEKDFYGGDIPFIRSAEIDKDRTELFLTKKGFGNSAAKLIKKGDVLVALYGANSGDVALARLDGAINQAILCLKSEGSNPFIYQFLSHKKGWIISTYIQGGQGNLSGEIIKSIQLPFPKLLEQQKIADCLTSLDDLIAAQGQKLDALKSHKKGLMQNLFPAEGESVPRVRFAEFQSAGEWEIKQFDELIDVIDGDRGINYPKSEEFFTSGYCVFLNAKNVTKNGFVFDEIQFITQEKDETLRKGKLRRSDIVLTTRGSVGNFALFSATVPYENIRLNSGMVILRIKSNIIDDNYFYIYNNSETISRIIERIAFGSAQPQLTVSEIKKFKLYYPKLLEQQKIADCLSSLDEQIAAQGQKLEALKVHKKGLMQGLFPSVGGAG